MPLWSVLWPPKPQQKMLHYSHSQKFVLVLEKHPTMLNAFAAHHSWAQHVPNRRRAGLIPEFHWNPSCQRSKQLHQGTEICWPVLRRQRMLKGVMEPGAFLLISRLPLMLQYSLSTYCVSDDTVKEQSRSQGACAPSKAFVNDVDQKIVVSLGGLLPKQAWMTALEGGWRKRNEWCS